MHVTYAVNQNTSLLPKYTIISFQMTLSPICMYMKLQQGYLPKPIQTKGNHPVSVQAHL